jgi:hypothetical protein
MTQSHQRTAPSHHIVVDDPSANFWEGAIVEASRAHELRARRVVTLPIEPGLMSRSAVGGYFRRSWGSGWPISGPVPKMVCPLILYVRREEESFRRIHWVARLVTETRDALEHVRSGNTVLGQLRLASDSGQFGSMTVGLGAPEQWKPIQGSDLGRPDSENGWTVYGDAIITAPTDGMAGFALYGSLQGLAVAWAAISQSR